MEIASERKTSRLRALLAALGITCLLAGLAVVAGAERADSAPLRVIVLGKDGQAPQPDCPGRYQKTPTGDVTLKSCLVEGHITGFQISANGVNLPTRVPFDGKIVSWSISLGKPSKRSTENNPDSQGIYQVNEFSFFNQLLDSPAQARIAVLRRVENADVKTFKMVRQSPIQVLNPYFGSTPQFVLDHPLTVVKNQIVALSIPTWAPMFSSQEPTSSQWRGSRKKGSCAFPSNASFDQLKAFAEDSHPQQKVGSKKEYTCAFEGARLLYTATLIKKPGS